MSPPAQDHDRVRAALYGPISDHFAPLLQLFEGNRDPFVTILRDGSVSGADVMLWELPSGGREALEEFVQVREELPGVPVVVIGRSENDALAIKLVRAGAHDCIFEPEPDRGRLRRALCFAANRASVLTSLRQTLRVLQGEMDALVRKYQEEANRLGRLRGSLNVAARIQKNLLPAEVPHPDAYDIGVYYHPCEEVGGDYYDFIRLGDGRIGIVVADVSGKGIPGLAGMTMFRGMLRINAKRSLHSRTPLRAVNKQIADDLPRGMFITCFYAVLDPAKAEMLVTNAGHPPLLIWRRESGSCEVVRPRGMMIGFDRGPRFDAEVKEERVTLSPGDRVLMYSDGLIEAQRDDDELFGRDRVIEHLRGHGGEDTDEFIRGLLNAVLDFRGNAQQNDDLTIVSFSYRP